MLSGKPSIEPRIYDEFEYANGELRRALITAIAVRAGKTTEAVSIQEACSDIPLADLYRRKVYGNRFIGFVDRLFRWWR